MITVSPPTMNACDELLRPTPNSRRGRTQALVYRDTAYTYDDLEAMVNRVGHALLRTGIDRGDRVLLLLKDSPDFVTCYLAAIKVGGVAVALNTRCAPKDLRFALDDTGCRVIVIDFEFLDIYIQAVAGREGPAPLLVVRGANAAAPAPAITLAAFRGGQPDRLVSTPMSPDDMAFWIYTSGTTGAPKAAVHRHSDVLLGDRHIGEILGVKPGDKLYSSSKLFFAFALGHCLLGGLRVGATLILHDGWPDSATVAETVAHYRPDFVFSVPTVYRNLLRDGCAETGAFESVRCFVSAGEKLPANLFERWRAATGKPILEGIGATETIFLTIANTPAAYRAGSTGRPQPGVGIRLLDEHDEPINEPGRSGLLWVRIGSLCSGYWNQPEKTSASFCDGWHRTGDAFSFDADGWWYHLGRGDDLLKISGQWVSPMEIEDCALGTPGVIDAAVVGVPNTDGLVRLAMFVVPADSDARDGLALRLQDRIKLQLSIYKCPRNITFVDEIPRTATGKVQRFRLRELAVQPA
jgi:benzoate-CoA ligase family protein